MARSQGSASETSTNIARVQESMRQSVTAHEISKHIETVADLANQNSFRAGQAAEIADHLHKLTHQSE